MVGAMVEDDSDATGMRPWRAATGPVLVVEDEPDVRDALLSLVEQMGFDAVGARNGQEALEVGRRETPSLILLDLMMPVMNGWDFRAAQRRDPTLADVPVIVVTAVGDAAREAKALGAAAGLQKPYDVDALEEALARFG